MQEIRTRRVHGGQQLYGTAIDWLSESAGHQPWLGVAEVRGGACTALHLRMAERKILILSQRWTLGHEIDLLGTEILLIKG